MFKLNILSGPQKKNSSRQKRHSANSRRRYFNIEPLEPRLLLSADFMPIDPSPGEQNIMDLIDSLPLNDIANALDSFPIPYVVIASADGGDAVVETGRAGAPTMVDVDENRATGRGGHDVIVEVNTELPTTEIPTPHLALNIDRIGTGAFVEDLQVIVAFPFDAFTDELLNGMSNLFFGYATNGEDGGNGGIAPLSSEFLFIPGLLGGTEHAFEFQLNTEGAENPLTFMGGFFEGDTATGVLNATGVNLFVDEVPNSIVIGLDVAENAIDDPLMESSFGMSWEATSSSLVELSYFENEDPLNGSNDYATSISFDAMPTSVDFSIEFDETAKTLTLSHRANTAIDEVSFNKTREDGLTIQGTATDVPTEVDITIDMDPSVVIDVNANTMDLELAITRAGGIPGTAGFFGSDLNFGTVSVVDVPDMTATWTPGFDTFSVMANNAGEFIPEIEFAIGYGPDSIAIDGTPQPELPPSYADIPRHHLFSLIDDGTNGTAMGRLLFVEEATLDLNADVTQRFQLTTSQAAPFQAYIMTTEDSNIIPEEVWLEINIDDMPAGTVDFEYNGPTDWSYSIDPPTGIDSVQVIGHIGTFNFDIAVGDLPALFNLNFDPGEHLNILAEDGMGGSDPVGFVDLRLYDEEDPMGLPDTTALFGATNPLRDARARVDNLPSFHSMWQDDDTGMTIDFDTDGTDVFLGGVQFSVSTIKELEAALPVASLAANHYILISDRLSKRMSAGAFGIDNFNFTSIDANDEIDLQYDANEDHRLTASIDSDFDSFFFPTMEIDTFVLSIDDIPDLFDFQLIFDPELHYTASDIIDEIHLTGTIDMTDDSTENGTEIDFLLESLPSEVDFELNPASDFALNMNDPIDLVFIRLSSEDNMGGIFGSDYNLIEATIEDIPANLVADWGGPGFMINSTDSSDNPVPFGTISALISTSNDPTDNDSKIEPFTLNGGTRISRSEFQQEIDDRYWPGGIEAVLDDIYNDGERLNDGEDHIVARKEGGSLDFASLQFTGFQEISWDPSVNDGEFIFRAPSPGLHPFFAGFEDHAENNEFMTVQIENVPDEIILQLDIAGGNINYDAMDDVNPSAGQIDFYQGPLPFAGDGDNATRIIMNDTPGFVHIDWDFGFPNGQANFDASNPFQVLFLNQNGNDRIVAGLELEDLHLDYGVHIPDISVDLDFTFPLPVPTSIDLRIGEAGAHFNNGASGTPVDGFFGLYEFRNGLQPLNNGGPGPSGGEYVPLVTAMMDDFSSLDIEVGFDIEIVPLLGAPQVEIDINLSLGSIVFDVWSNVETDATFSIFGFDFGFFNAPDYTENSPFHIFPLGAPDFDNIGDAVFTFVGFHDFGDHSDPFALIATAPPIINNEELVVDDANLAMITAEAINQWTASGLLTEDQINTMNTLEFEIRDLDGLTLGQVEGDTVVIDINAADYGWFVDPTPALYEEFVSGDSGLLTALEDGSASGTMDLLTVVMHEIGHALGFTHSDSTLDVMSETLDAGVRIEPVTSTENDSLQQTEYLVFDEETGTFIIRYTEDEETEWLYA